MADYMRSDLARECGCLREQEGICVTRAEIGGREILRVRIKDPDVARRIGKPCGRYVTVALGDGASFGAETARVLSVEMREMAERMAGKRISKDFSVLVVGLGNADMIADALGPATVKKVSVTRHVSRPCDAPQLGGGVCRLAAFAPGVVGQTGLETVELVRGAVAAVAPDLVIAVDALVARETAHLGATAQLSDTGVQPGGGIGAARPAVTAEALGVPVMALGIPTVVESETLVGDALVRVGVDRRTPAFADLVHHGESFFVTPKEIDLLLPLLSDLLARAIERAFAVGLSN
ncbi:MAG: GPR endopeptidase [Clostridia bacterium]|nr:GPR endopeptidase [Clostridia bacterium]